MKSETQHDHRRDDGYDDDRADRPTAPTTLACLSEEELGVELLDERELIEQDHEPVPAVCSFLSSPRPQ
jgi:hypothetical protein